MGRNIYLDYNAIMKKITLLLITALFSFNCAVAKPAGSNYFNKFFNKQTVEKQSNAQQLSAEEEMTPSKEAIVLYNDNNVKAAFEKLIKIPEKDRSAQDWLLIGNLLFDQGKLSDSIFMYKRAIGIDPSFYKAYYNLGNIYLEDEKPHLAIENYRKVNKLNPEFAYAYYNLGCAYIKAGELKKAKIAFIKAIELKNTEPDFHYNLAYAYKKLNNHKLAKQYLDNYNKLMANRVQ